MIIAFIAMFTAKGNYPEYFEKLQLAFMMLALFHLYQHWKVMWVSVKKIYNSLKSKNKNN